MNLLDDLLEWRDSPEGQQFSELADALCDLMESVHLDAAQRRFIWPDGTRLDLDQSVGHIQKQHPDFRRDWIEEYLIDWIDMDYVPEHYSQAQLDELDRLPAQWITDHLRRAKTSKKIGKLVTLEIPTMAAKVSTMVSMSFRLMYFSLMRLMPIHSR
jgi:hypothetical protein